MKKKMLTLLFFLTLLTSFAQETLFIGLYSNAASGKSYWCRDMEMVQQIVKSDAEAQQLAINFKKEHEKDSPIVKIVRKGSIVLYDFLKEDKAFKCTYRVIGWKEGKTKNEARDNLDRDLGRILREYNGKAKEIFAWSDKVDNTTIEISFTLEGISVTLKKVNNETGNGTWNAKIDNPLKNEAAHIVFLVDDVRNPTDSKKTFKLQPCEVLNVNLGKGNQADVLLRLTKKDEVEEPGAVNKIKNYLRQKVIEKGGKLEIDGLPFSVRG